MVSNFNKDKALAEYLKNKSKLYSTKEEASVIENPKRSNYSAIITEMREVEEKDSNLQEAPVNRRLINFSSPKPKKKVPHHIVLSHDICIPGNPAARPRRRRFEEIIARLLFLFAVGVAFPANHDSFFS